MSRAATTAPAITDARSQNMARNRGVRVTPAMRTLARGAVLEVLG